MDDTKPASAINAVKSTADTFLAAMESATAAARTERTRLETEIADLQAKHAEAKRRFDDMHGMSTLEFIKRCIDAEIDKHTIDELRAKIGAK